MKTFEEIVLAFLPVESKTNIFYVDINFPGNLFIGFGRYCGKVVPEPTVYHPFFSAGIHNKCSFNIFSHWQLVKVRTVVTKGCLQLQNSRNKTAGTKGCRRPCYASLVLKQLILLSFS